MLEQLAPDRSVVSELTFSVMDLGFESQSGQLFFPPYGDHNIQAVWFYLKDVSKCQRS